METVTAEPNVAAAIRTANLTLDGVPFVATERRFTTGSRGYHATGKAMVNGERCQVNVVITVIGSKTEAQ